MSTNTATLPRLAAAVPQFSVSDVLATVHYYRDRLGFYDACFRVSGVDQLAAEFRERGAVIREGPPNRVYDMREVVIEDLNGLVLAFGEPIGSGAAMGPG